MELSSGDVVWRKDGGFPMTVEDVSIDGSVNCIWFEYNGKLRRKVFGIFSLTKIKPANGFDALETIR